MYIIFFYIYIYTLFYISFSSTEFSALSISILISYFKTYKTDDFSTKTSFFLSNISNSKFLGPL